jgi:glycine/D-amino acid oxidase-like deaminating enzyme
LSPSELEKRFPQINFGSVRAGERSADGATGGTSRVKDFVHQGSHFLPEPVAAPSTSKKISSISTRLGEKINAGSFVFVCGPWLPRVFPALLGNRIFSNAPGGLFFEVPPGDRRWTPPAMPAWIDVDLYGIPDLESRGFKIANDQHGPPFDPDSSDRFVTKEQVAEMRSRLGQLFPGLKDRLWWSRVFASMRTARMVISWWILTPT